MKAKVISTGFAFGRLVEPGEVIEVRQPASWYEIIEAAPSVEPKTESKLAKGKVKPAAPAPAGNSGHESLL